MIPYRSVTAGDISKYGRNRLAPTPIGYTSPPLPGPVGTPNTLGGLQYSAPNGGVGQGMSLDPATGGPVSGGNLNYSPAMAAPPAGGFAAPSIPSATMSTSGSAPVIPGTGDTEKPGVFGKFLGGDGFDLGDVGQMVGIAGDIGKIWNAFQTNKLAKKEFEFQKQAYQTNLTNSISSYNLALTDRMTARYAQNNKSQEEANAYIEQNKLRA